MGEVIRRVVDGRRSLAVVLALGVVARLAIILLVVPDAQAQWFSPFLGHLVSTPSIDPWQSFLDAGGDAAAFPYGPVMLVYYAAFALLTAWLPGSLAVQLGIGLGTLVAEMVLWRLVTRWPGLHWRPVLALLALSPIVFYAAYVHGQLDMVPTVLMFASALALKRHRWAASGLLVGLAIAAKYSSALMAPLVIIFLLRNTRYRRFFGPYLLGLLPGVVITLLPAVLPGYRAMVLSTPTSQSIFSYTADLGPGLTIVLLPIVYSALLGLQYRYKRGNADLLVMLVGYTPTAVTLPRPARAGWYLWSVPFLAMLSVLTSPRSVWMVYAFWWVASVTLALRASGAVWRWESGDSILETGFIEVGPFVNQSDVVGAVLATATVVVGAVALIMIYRGGAVRFDEYKLSRMPLSIAIAGDSGTGKDTLCISMAGVFGERATSFLFGDDYHLYERGAPIWQVSTHLHPATNDLASMGRDAVTLMRGRAVWAKHYDHVRGRFTKERPIDQRELVVTNGLHMLTSDDVRKTADLKVFMSMEERLRRQLKVNRDVGERNQDLASVLASIDRRIPDAEAYVWPQAPLSDVEFRIESVTALPEEISVTEQQLELRLVAVLRDFTFMTKLQRLLTGLGNCPCTIQWLPTPGEVQLTVYPEMITAADTAEIARKLIVRPEELFVDEPVWLGKSRGVMQLIVMAALLERRANRWERV